MAVNETLRALVVEACAGPTDVGVVDQVTQRLHLLLRVATPVVGVLLKRARFDPFEPEIVHGLPLLKWEEIRRKHMRFTAETHDA